MLEIDDEMETVMETGERLPAEMWEDGLSDVPMNNPVFDGQKVIDAVEG